ncbi:MAG: UvrD-helicase domain-containing protein, partial [Flavobacteriaceae bacterium]|nr:UvrD-helicase domain-containing protein [Flavobacteriaceae bacterium]
MASLQNAFASPFTIYNASAGSGKTYTLSLLFIGRLLTSNEALAQRRLLAITFTKKAAQEMKLRIIEQLMQIATETDEQDPKTQAFITHIAELTNLSKDEIINRAKRSLQQLFSHYGLFQVTTIDAFNFRLLQQFAFDLNLPQDFEAYLDSETLMQEATEAIFSRIGSDDALTKLVIDFAERAFKEKGAVRIFKEVSEFSLLLTQEKNFGAIQKILQLNPKQRSEDRKQLQIEIAEAEKQFKSTLSEALQVLNKDEVLETAKRSYFYKFLVGLHQSKHPADGFFKKYTDPKAPQYLTTEDDLKLHTQKTPAAVKSLLDEMTPRLLALRKQMIEQASKITFYKEILKSLLPTSLIGDFAEAVQTIKQEQQIVPIHEFNFIIHQHIKTLPVPFIYERIGNRIQHYFIDEFQDTSVMQWENIMPLVENSFQSINDQTGSLSLMGDVKQSIYRFRGGNPEQFSALIHDKS